MLQITVVPGDVPGLPGGDLYLVGPVHGRPVLTGGGRRPSQTGGAAKASVALPVSPASPARASRAVPRRRARRERRPVPLRDMKKSYRTASTVARRRMIARAARRRRPDDARDGLALRVAPLARWLSSPGRSLRVAVVTLSAGAAVPALCSFPYTKVGLGVSPEAPFITLVSTGLPRLLRHPPVATSPATRAFRRGVERRLRGAQWRHRRLPVGGLRLRRSFLSLRGSHRRRRRLRLRSRLRNRERRSGQVRPPEVGGARRGSMTGTWWRTSRASSSSGSPPCSSSALFARTTRRAMASPGSQPTSGPLAVRDPLLGRPRPWSPRSWAAFTAQRQRRLRRWLDRVVRGDEPRYRVVPLADGSTDASCSLLARGQRVEAESLLVRVDEEVETADSAYRQMERLTPLARLAP